jgi:nicotinamide riboside kinase
MSMVTISGPPLSGKTTLWQALSERLSGRFEFVPDLPRIALEKLDPQLRAWSTPEFQHYIGFAQLIAEHANSEGRVVVYDKSLIDALAYWRALFESGTPPWSAALHPGRYRVAFVCDYRDIDAAVARGIHTVHLGDRESIEREVLRGAGESADRVICLSGPPAARIGVAISALDLL